MSDKKEVIPINSKPKNQFKNPMVWIVGTSLLYMFIGFIVVPFVLLGQAVDFIKEKYNRDAQIEIVSFNPFTLHSPLRDFYLMNKIEN